MVEEANPNASSSSEDPPAAAEKEEEGCLPNGSTDGEEEETEACASPSVATTTTQQQEEDGMTEATSVPSTPAVSEPTAHNVDSYKNDDREETQQTPLIENAEEEDPNHGNSTEEEVEILTPESLPPSAPDADHATTTKATANEEKEETTMATAGEADKQKHELEKLYRKRKAREQFMQKQKEGAEKKAKKAAVEAEKKDDAATKATNKAEATAVPATTTEAQPSEMTGTPSPASPPTHSVTAGLANQATTEATANDLVGGAAEEDTTTAIAEKSDKQKQKLERLEKERKAREQFMQKQKKAEEQKTKQATVEAEKKEATTRSTPKIAACAAPVIVATTTEAQPSEITGTPSSASPPTHSATAGLADQTTTEATAKDLVVEGAEEDTTAATTETADKQNQKLERLEKEQKAREQFMQKQEKAAEQKAKRTTIEPEKKEATTRSTPKIAACATPVVAATTEASEMTGTPSPTSTSAPAEPLVQKEEKSPSNGSSTDDEEESQSPATPLGTTTSAIAKTDVIAASSSAAPAELLIEKEEKGPSSGSSTDEDEEEETQFSAAPVFAATAQAQPDVTETSASTAAPVVEKERKMAQTNGESTDEEGTEYYASPVAATTTQAQSSDDTSETEPTTPNEDTQQQRTSPRAAAPTPRSIVSSIVVRQTEETLQVLQSSLRHSSVDLLQSLGKHLSQQGRPIGGISLPASAVGWLASHRAEAPSNIQNLLPRLTHLRLTGATWPEPPSASPPPTTSSSDPPESPSFQRLQQQYASLQSFHRLRYNPEVDVTVFSNLQVLLLDQVPPDWIVHLPKLQATLRVLRVERAALYDLETLLLGPASGAWGTYTQLSHLKLTHCNLGEQTKGLALSEEEEEEEEANSEQRLPLARMPRIISLSLAHNEIRAEETILECGITRAPLLSKLDISYNHISTFQKAPRFIGNIQTLILTGNQLKSAEGLDRLYSLQTLALDYNQIQSWLQIKGLARLPELKELKLRGNPFMETSSAERKYVRVMLLDLFREQRWSSSVQEGEATFRQLEFILPVIDGKPASDRELKALQQRAYVTVPTVRVARDRERPMEEPSHAASFRDEAAANDDPEATRLDEGWILVARSRGSQEKKKKRRRVPTAIIGDGNSPLRSSGATVPLLWPRLAKENNSNGTSEKPMLAERRGRKSELSGSTVADEEKKEAGNDHDVRRGEAQVTGTPRVNFGIREIIMSLGPNTANGTTSATSQQEESQEPTQQAQTQQAEGSVPDGKGASASSGKPLANKFAEFDWPQPLPYLPKENLYKEFVWNPPAAISLSEENKEISKQKTRKKKKLKKKPPPAISTASVGHEERSTASSKKSMKRPPGPKRADTSQRKEKTRSLSPKAKARSPGANTTSSVSRGSSPKARPSGITGEAGSSFEWAAKSQQASVEQKEGEDEAHSINGAVENESIAAIGALSAGKAGRPLAPTGDDTSSDGGDVTQIMSPNSTGAAFPFMAMETVGGDDLTTSSLGTNRSGATAKSGKLKGPSRQDNFLIAEVKSKFLGMEQERGLAVASNLELYFKTFVFPDFVPDLGAGQLNGDADTWQSVFFRYPRIQLLPKDRDLREKSASKTKSMEMQTHGAAEEKEQFVKVWKEDVVACGKPSLRRLPPNRTAHFGFHGELSWLEGKVKTVSECRSVIMCLSNTSLYIITDNDSLTAKEQAAPATGTARDAVAESPKSRRKVRKYPSPLPADATFEQALWPHAVACHPLGDVLGITIGFGFQRMALRIRNSAYPSAVEFSYQLLTSNKMKTVDLLRELQGLVKEVKLELGSATLTDEVIKIDNDDRQFLDALAAAVAPEPLGAVLHYQILKQRWKHGQRGAVSRIVVVTDGKIFLLDEDYLGDGSESLTAESGRRLGSPSFRLIDAADLQQISEVKAADADPNAITIIIRPIQTLLRTHRWRLLCRDRSGAEKLVEDVRKAMTLAEMCE